MNTEVDSYTMLQLSQMALDQKYGNTGTVASQDEDEMTNLTSTTCTSLSYKTSISSSSNLSGLSGWGSAVSRKSYACLRTLEEESRKADLLKQQQQQRPHTLIRPNSQFYQQGAPAQIQNNRYVGDTWGYFVDTPDQL